MHWCGSRSRSSQIRHFWPDPEKIITDPDPGSPSQNNEFERKLLCQVDKIHNFSTKMDMKMSRWAKICNLTLLQDGYTKGKFMFKLDFWKSWRIRNRIRIRIRNDLKRRIRIRIRKKSFRIHNTAANLLIFAVVPLSVVDPEWFFSYPDPDPVTDPAFFQKNIIWT